MADTYEGPSKPLRDLFRDPFRNWASARGPGSLGAPGSWSSHASCVGGTRLMVFPRFLTLYRPRNTTSPYPPSSRDPPSGRTPPPIGPEEKTINKKTHKQNFMGSSQQYTGTFLKVLFMCSIRERQTHQQIRPPPVPGTIPKSCLC